MGALLLMVCVGSALALSFSALKLADEKCRPLWVRGLLISISFAGAFSALEALQRPYSLPTGMTALLVLMAVVSVLRAFVPSVGISFGLPSSDTLECRPSSGSHRARLSQEIRENYDRSAHHRGIRQEPFTG